MMTGVQVGGETTLSPLTIRGSVPPTSLIVIDREFEFYEFVILKI